MQQIEELPALLEVVGQMASSLVWIVSIQAGATPAILGGDLLFKRAQNLPPWYTSVYQVFKVARLSRFWLCPKSHSGMSEFGFAAGCEAVALPRRTRHL